MITSALHSERLSAGHTRRAARRLARWPMWGPACGRLAAAHPRLSRPAPLAAIACAVALASGCAAAQPPGVAAPAKPRPAAATQTATGTSQPVVVAAPSAAATAPSAVPVWPAGPRTGRAGFYGFLTAIHPGEHATYDRVVFQFTGDVPGYQVSYVPRVYHDASGRPVWLAGQAYLRVVFHDGSEFLLNGQRSYHGPNTLSPYFPALRQIKLAGDFEGYLSFGIGLGKRTGFRAFTLTHPNRVVIDVAH